MRNTHRWKATKFVHRKHGLRVTRDTKEVSVGSRLIADLTARLYGEHLPEHCRGALMDLGCGKVPLYQLYRPLTSSVTCLDWPRTLHGTQFIDVMADLGRPLPFRKESFDTIIASDVFEHVPEPAALWNEMGRVLRSGGKVIANTPFYYWLHEEPHDYYRYTEFALRRLAEDAGFSVVLLEVVGGARHVMADILSKHLADIPLLGHALALLTQGIVRRYGTHRPLRQVSGSVEKFPLAYFMVAERSDCEDE